jgi:hypothetical protein
MNAVLAQWPTVAILEWATMLECGQAHGIAIAIANGPQ